MTVCEDPLCGFSIGLEIMLHRTNEDDVPCKDDKLDCLFSSYASEFSKPKHRLYDEVFKGGIGA